MKHWSVYQIVTTPYRSVYTFRFTLEHWSVKVNNSAELLTGTTLFSFGTFRPAHSCPNLLQRLTPTRRCLELKTLAHSFVRSPPKDLFPPSSSAPSMPTLSTISSCRGTSYGPCKIGAAQLLPPPSLLSSQAYEQHIHVDALTDVPGGATAATSFATASAY
jgi:hypothetical protein